MRDWTENQIMLAFIRHGAAQANQEKRYLGKTDEPLCEEGAALLEVYKMQKIYPKAAYLFSSPMKRCTQTAQILYPALCPIIIPEWEEIDFGKFEYKNYEELQFDAEYQKWLRSGGTLDFPQGESRKDFTLRCKSGFIRMCKELRQAAGQKVKNPVLAGIIVHGGVIMSLLSSYCGNHYFDYQVSNGRGYVCRLTGVHDKTAKEDPIQIEVVSEI